MISEDRIEDAIALLKSLGHTTEAELLGALREERNAAAADAFTWREVCRLDVKILHSAAAVLEAISEHRDFMLQTTETVPARGTGHLAPANDTEPIPSTIRRYPPDSPPHCYTPIYERTGTVRPDGLCDLCLRHKDHPCHLPTTAPEKTP